VQTGRDLFELEVKDRSAALRSLLRSGDSWIVACAAAASAELGLHDLRADIEPLARNAGADVGAVARAALASLSAA
jgi:hypothetical protein